AAPGEGAAMDVPRPPGHAEGLGRDDPPAGGRHMKRSAIRIGVVFIEGTNCEDESVAFFRHLGAQAERVHLKQLTGNVPAELRRDLDDYDLLMIPGGFAAGDYVRAGTIFAARLRSKLSKDLVDFVRSGKPIFGVCNGFQVLDDRGKYAGYPWNPSGTTYNIAAICNREGNVFGVQPHPERCFFRQLGPSWTRGPPDDSVYGDGQALFESSLQYLEKRF